MIINGADLNSKEKAALALRGLYSTHGFSLYRMSKFESFDLYARNRDFMDSASIITFTDTDGRLMALKPDVTLSIIKNNRHIGDGVRKLYYNENIYRVSPKTHYFKEIDQVGLECLGNVGEDLVCEVLALAAESLGLVADRAVLCVSDLDILSSLIRDCGASKDTEKEIADCISQKNAHELRRICGEAGVDPARTADLLEVIGIYGPPRKALPKLKEAFPGRFEEQIGMLEKITDAVEEAGFGDMLTLDFSVVSDLKYYNGVYFKGFVEGNPDGVLSGGQYDKLMQNMGRRSRAIGFAVYMDNLGRLPKMKDREVTIRG